jgi:hypothetical protein
MPSVKNINDGYNKRTLESSINRESNNTRKECNCRIPGNCPMNGRCLKESIIYQATVTTSESKETYIGLTKNTFKERFNGHTKTFKNPSKRNSTELSKHGN